VFFFRLIFYLKNIRKHFERFRFYITNSDFFSDIKGDYKEIFLSIIRIRNKIEIAFR